MVKLIVLTVIVAFAFSVTGATRTPTTVEGGAIHFRGEIVEGEDFDPVTKQPVNTHAVIDSVAEVKIIEDKKVVGKIMTITWD